MTNQIEVPRYSKRYRRLCQVAAATGTPQTVRVVLDLIKVSMVFGEGPWAQPKDLIATIDEVFGLIPLESDVRNACEQGIDDGTLRYDGRVGSYLLSNAEREKVAQRIDEGDLQERAVMANWFSAVDDLLPDVNMEAAWQCLADYLSAAFLRFGVEALPVLVGEVEFAAGFEKDDVPSEMLRASMRRVGVDPSLHGPLLQAVGIFCDGADPERTAYLGDLANATFAFMTLALDDETRAMLRAGLPKLSLFLDTNVIHGVIGAHSQPLATASADLTNVILEARLPFELYYHEKTLTELERTVEAAFHRIRSVRWSQSMSRAIVRTPTIVSSLELKYHQQNAIIGTDPAVFFGKFENMPLLLKEYGLKIYREPNDQSTTQTAELVAEYQEYAKTRAKGRRRRSYEQLDHDVRVWQAANSRQLPHARSQMLSGALLISADNLLRSFDRDVLSDLYGHGVATVLRPDTFLQSLRPFVTTFEDYEAAFARSFSSPEFRGIGGFEDIGGKVAAYLATYEDFPEETAVRLLTNTVLMSRLRKLDEEDEEWAKLIADAIVDENERLLGEREEFLATSRAAIGLRDRAEVASTSLQKLIDGGQIDAQIADGVREALGVLQETQTHVTMIEKVSIDMSKHGDKFVNKDSQIVGQGSHARVEGSTTLSMDNRAVNVDMQGLIEELGRLRTQMAQSARSSEEFHGVGEVVAAIEAAEAEDRPEVQAKLKQAGAFALGIARDLGLKIAEAAIKQSLGMP